MQVLVVRNLLHKQRISCFYMESKSLTMRIVMQENEKLMILLRLIQSPTTLFYKQSLFERLAIFQLQKWVNVETPFLKLQIRLQELSQVNYTLLNYSLYNYKSSILLLQILDGIKIEEQNPLIIYDYIYFGEWKDTQKHGFGKLLGLD